MRADGLGVTRCVGLKARIFIGTDKAGDNEPRAPLPVVREAAFEARLFSRLEVQ
jgi:hypothetical protein